MKVLYVDDEPTNLLLFKINFDKKYVILTAENPEQAFEIITNTNDIKIVISDMNMPKMNGIEFITKAKALFPDIKYYILTGYDISEEIANALNNGLIIDYFQKPFDITAIDRAIIKALVK